MEIKNIKTTCIAIGNYFIMCNKSKYKLSKKKNKNNYF